MDLNKHYKMKETMVWWQVFTARAKHLVLLIFFSEKLIFVWVTTQSDNCSAQHPSTKTLVWYCKEVKLFFEGVIVQMCTNGSCFNPPLIMFTNSAAMQYFLFSFYYRCTCRFTSRGKNLSIGKILSRVQKYKCTSKWQHCLDKNTKMIILLSENENLMST